MQYGAEYEEYVNTLITEINFLDECVVRRETLFLAQKEVSQAKSKKKRYKASDSLVAALWAMIEEYIETLDLLANKVCSKIDNMELKLNKEILEAKSIYDIIDKYLGESPLEIQELVKAYTSARCKRYLGIDGYIYDVCGDIFVTQFFGNYLIYNKDFTLVR